MAYLSVGVHPDIPDDIYHADDLCAQPTLSSTVARKMLQSPLHGWTAHPRLNPDYESADKAAFDIGRAVHRAVLGKGGEYVAIPSEYLAANGAASTKAAKDFIEDARASGWTPLKAHEVERVQGISRMVSERLGLMGIRLDPERSELTALGEIDGAMCRARFDNLPERGGVIYDIKTTTDASADAVIRSVEAYGYDVQAAHYLATLEAATGQRRKMRFIFVEKMPPFEVSVIELHDAPGDESDWMVVARDQAAEARRRWVRCLRTNIWPGYPRAVQIVGARGWKQARWEQQAADRTDNPSPAVIRAAYDAQKPERTMA